MKLDNNYITLLILITIPLIGLVLNVIQFYKLKKYKEVNWKFQIITWCSVILSFFVSNNLPKVEDYFRLRNPNLLSKYETIDLENIKYVLLGRKKDIYIVAEYEVKDNILIIYKNTIKEMKRIYDGEYQYREYKEVREELR